MAKQTRYGQELYACDESVGLVSMISDFGDPLSRLMSSLEAETFPQPLTRM
jgi:hypothetical protein